MKHLQKLSYSKNVGKIHSDILGDKKYSSNENKTKISELRLNWDEYRRVTHFPSKSKQLKEVIWEFLPFLVTWEFSTFFKLGRSNQCLWTVVHLSIISVISNTSPFSLSAMIEIQSQRFNITMQKFWCFLTKIYL